jgi:hypothetical protein
MRILEKNHVDEIERILGRPLSPDEITPVQAIELLPSPVRLVAMQVAVESRSLAVMYLREMTPGVRLGHVVEFLEMLIAECS